MRIRIIATLAALVSLSVLAQTIERPTVTVGDECAYDILDNLRKGEDGNPVKIAEQRGTVTAVGDGGITITWALNVLSGRDTDDLDSGVATYDMDLNQTLRDGRTFDPPFPLRIYPVYPGIERKDARSSFQSPQGNPVTVTLDGAVSNWEKNTVPAGTFDTLTINWEGGYNVSNGIHRWSGRQQHLLSYSPATSCLVEGTFKRFRPNGTILIDRRYVLTGHKN